jgi:ribosomal protein S27E
MAIFSPKISVNCSECSSTLVIARPHGVNLDGTQWEVMSCPSCGHNLAAEARLVLAETAQKEGICIVLIGLCILGVCFFIRSM